MQPRNIVQRTCRSGAAIVARRHAARHGATPGQAVGATRGTACREPARGEIAWRAVCVMGAFPSAGMRAMPPGTCRPGYHSASIADRLGKRTAAAVGLDGAWSPAPPARGPQERCHCRGASHRPAAPDVWGTTDRAVGSTRWRVRRGRAQVRCTRGRGQRARHTPGRSEW
jgi:hypothetical protein